LIVSAIVGPKAPKKLAFFIKTLFEARQFRAPELKQAQRELAKTEIQQSVP
jgi:hypothetical protein